MSGQGKITKPEKTNVRKEFEHNGQIFETHFSAQTAPKPHFAGKPRCVSESQKRKRMREAGETDKDGNLIGTQCKNVVKSNKYCKAHKGPRAGAGHGNSKHLKHSTKQTLIVNPQFNRHVINNDTLGKYYERSESLKGGDPDLKNELVLLRALQMMSIDDLPDFDRVLRDIERAKSVITDGGDPDEVYRILSGINTDNSSLKDLITIIETIARVSRVQVMNATSILESVSRREVDLMITSFFATVQQTIFENIKDSKLRMVMSSDIRRHLNIYVQAKSTHEILDIVRDSFGDNGV
jgi:hypothetical protein